MTASENRPLVTTDWLEENIDNPEVCVCDASWYLPTMNRDGYTDYQDLHIPGAVFWNIDKIADQKSPLPHTIPSTPQFQSDMRKLGIGDESTVVVYDGMGLFSAARPWWILRAFGHEKVFVLDGGLPKWKAEGRPLTDKPPKVRATNFSRTLNKDFFRTTEQILKYTDDNSVQILDARSEGRFLGKDPEPRPGCRPGHIPSSRNLPFDRLIDPKTKTILPNSDLISEFTHAGIDIDKPLVTSCGSGVTACVLALGMYALNKKKVSVYDGSWSEWGSNKNLPVEKKN